MKKIVILCGCIAVLLLLSFADGTMQKKKLAADRGQTAGQGAYAEAGADEGENVRTSAAIPNSGDGGEERTQGNVDALGGSVDAPGSSVNASGGSVNVSGGKILADTEADGGQNIRVLIKTAGFAGEYHEEITVSSETGFTVTGESGTWQSGEGEKQTFTADSEAFGSDNVLYLKSADGQFEIYGLQRARVSETYEGILEIRRTDEGLLLINELLLERYLCGVVPSEMPSSYPEEALKAQAVCARTYAEKRMQEKSASAFFADVDDSVSYQVYNNQDRSVETDAAVAATAGRVLVDENGLIDALYYSTSCGLDLHMDLSKETVFAAFLQTDQVKAYEAEEPWYRWQTSLFLENLPGVSAITAQARQESGAVQELCITYESGESTVVEGEYEIRKFLAGAVSTVTLQDGEMLAALELLPSAFFILQPQYEEGALVGYHILGGGYGHGNGMSQNGAKHMALEGLTYQEILQNYYQNAELQ